MGCAPAQHLEVAGRVGRNGSDSPVDLEEWAIRLLGLGEGGGDESTEPASPHPDPDTVPDIQVHSVGDGVAESVVHGERRDARNDLARSDGKGGHASIARTASQMAVATAALLDRGRSRVEPSR